MTTEQIAKQPAPAVPDADCVLAGLLEAVQTPEAQGSRSTPLEPLEQSTENASFQALLRVLTYSYATGVYASAEIEDALNRDPVLRYLANGQRHESGTLRSFRRRNRPAVQRCLARTLENSWISTHPGYSGARQRAQPYVQWSLERWGTQQFAPDFEDEAACRVRQAIRDDTALLDE